MIVRPRPNAFQLLFTLRGSILPRVAPKILVIVVLSLLVLGLAEQHLFMAEIALLPFSFLGLALSIFLGFRNNACYDRWWEARRHWGDLIVQCRGFAREVTVLLAQDERRVPVVRATAGFAAALAARLRGADEVAAARPWVTDALAASLPARRNVPNAILRDINATLGQCLHEGRLSDILYQNLERHLHAMSAVQAACERIHGTPMPFAYSLLLHRTAWLFCLLLPFGLVSAVGWMTPVVVAITAYTFFGLDALGDELEEPFGLTDHDLPLNALVRTIEIDVLEALGADEIPEPLQPRRFLLQ